MSLASHKWKRRPFEDKPFYYQDCERCGAVLFASEQAHIITEGPEVCPGRDDEQDPLEAAERAAVEELRHE